MSVATGGGGSFNMANVLDMLSVLSLPGGPLRTDTERQQDLAIVNDNVRVLVPKLFKSYDRRRPSHTPVEVQAFMVVDHIEQLDELQQMLYFHATLLLSWEDRRLVWEPADYGNVHRLAFSSFDLLRFWTPSISAKGITLMSRNLNQFHNTEYTLTSEGRVFAEIAVSLRATCQLDLRDYPRDNQTCTISLLSPLHSSEEVTFTETPSFITRETLFNDDNTTVTSGFRLEALDAVRYYTYSGALYSTAAFTTPDADAQRTGTSVRFQLRLRRDAVALYITHIALPLFCIAVVTFAGMLLSDARMALAWLVLCVALQFYVNMRGVSALPVAYYENSAEPVCLQVARILLVETLVLIVYRMFITFQVAESIKSGGDDEKSLGMGSTIRRHLVSLNWTVQYFLAAETVFLFWLLFV